MFPTRTHEIVSALDKAIHDLYQEFVPISKRVTSLDYPAIAKAATFSVFQDAITRLEALELEALPENDKKAFFINLYNVIVIRALAMGEGPKNNWVSRLSFYSTTACKIGERAYTLNEIEHGILRCNRRVPFWVCVLSNSDEACRHTMTCMDPRVHFALNCGAASCPPVRFYQAKNLDHQLTNSTSDFLNNDAHFKIDVEKKTITMSMLLYFYAKDFGPHGSVNEVLAFCKPFLDITKQHALELVLQSHKTPKVKYFKYDWTLNAVIH